MAIEQLDALTIELGGRSELILMGILAFIMFAVALGLHPRHFSFFKSDPKHYLTGVGVQIIALPLLTLGLIYLFNPAPSLALGMIIIACCPGGNMSNLLAMFARANTALSVSMTATSSLAAAFITPISIVFWLSLYGPTQNLLQEIDFDILDFLMQTLLILAVPVALGMALVWRAPKLAARLQKPLGTLAAIILVVFILGAFYRLWDIFIIGWALVLPLVIIHNSLAMGLGYCSGLLSRADIPTRRALTFEIGIQNAGLGLVILLTQLSGLSGATAIVAMWGLWHLVSGSIVVGLFRAADLRGA